MTKDDLVDYSTHPLESEDIWVFPLVSGVVEVEAPPLTWVGGCLGHVFSLIQIVEGFTPSYFLLSSPSPFQIPEFALIVSGEGSVGNGSLWK